MSILRVGDVRRVPLGRARGPLVRGVRRRGGARADLGAADQPRLQAVPGVQALRAQERRLVSGACARDAGAATDVAARSPHMTCRHCSHQFCWGCLRERTTYAGHAECGAVAARDEAEAERVLAELRRAEKEERKSRDSENGAIFSTHTTTQPKPITTKTLNTSHTS